MLSTTSEYALLMMVLLTQAEGKPQTCAELSEAGGIPQQYGWKVLGILRRAGMVQGQRGRYGGFELQCDPSTTSMLDVVNVIAPLQRMEDCPLCRETDSSRFCALHAEMDKAMGATVFVLGQRSLSELVAHQCFDHS